MCRIHNHHDHVLKFLDSVSPSIAQGPQHLAISLPHEPDPTPTLPIDSLEYVDCRILDDLWNPRIHVLENRFLLLWGEPGKLIGK
jgi:hypothetical protein